jgi:hypothetical protein
VIPHSQGTERFCGLHTNYAVDHIKSSGYYTYHQFNIQQFYVLPTQCVYVFCVDLRTNGDYFPIQVVSHPLEQPEVTSRDRDVNKHGGGVNDLSLPHPLTDMQII